MRVITIGILDYGVGNLTSVWNSLHGIGYRCHISNKPEQLINTDILLLPGVGSFPTAMDSIYKYELFEFIQEWARKGKPIIGICLGMQLLAEFSYEKGKTAGLGLIPGEVKHIEGLSHHIGWNSIEVLNINKQRWFNNSNGKVFYFNHSFVFSTPSKYRSIVSRININSECFTVGVSMDNIVGFQFHPEKSQDAGIELFHNTVKGLFYA